VETLPGFLSSLSLSQSRTFLLWGQKFKLHAQEAALTHGL
jgi:hypothetical protein